LPWFQNKTENDSECYFSTIRSWHAKADQPLENKAKKGGREMEHGQKVGGKSHFGYKFHNRI